jgi:hypothetical protein
MAIYDLIETPNPDDPLVSSIVRLHLFPKPLSSTSVVPPIAIIDLDPLLSLHNPPCEISGNQALFYTDFDTMSCD